jgi:hypothetical protein
MQPVARSEDSSASVRRPDAGFLAHLIATAQREPQTLARRRAGSAEAVAAYGAAVADKPAAAGGNLSRGM